jgi:hypothetical protein
MREQLSCDHTQTHQSTFIFWTVGVPDLRLCIENAALERSLGVVQIPVKHSDASVLSNHEDTANAEALSIRPSCGSVGNPIATEGRHLINSCTHAGLRLDKGG